MSSINPITINITLQTLPIPQQGFGMPLIIGSDTAEIAYQEVTNAAELTTYTSSDDEYMMCAAFFAQNPRPEICAVYRKATITTYGDALNNLILTENEWYCLLSTSKAKADLNTLGTWAGSNGKIYIGACSDATALDTRNQIREAYLIHINPDETSGWPDAAWAGACLTATPGSVTWAYKRPNGVTESGLNTTDTNAVITANGNVLAKMAGQVATYPGKTTGGEFIDVIVARDYIEARLSEELNRTLLVNGKIPYTIDGFKQIQSVVQGVLKNAGLLGIVATVDSEDDKTRSDLGDYQYQIVIPTSLSDVPANDRANRKMPLTFRFRIAGAIHLIDITGYITV